MSADTPSQSSTPPPTETGARTTEDEQSADFDDRLDGVDANDARSISSESRQVPMRFIDVVMNLPSTNPVVILAEVDQPHRVLRIPIGLPEGVAISYAMSGIATPRPLTHVLMTSVLESFSLTVEVMRITSVKAGVYAAELIVSGPAGTKVFDCRPSDGIALALRQSIVPPLTAAGAVLDLMGFADEKIGSVLPS